MTSALAIYLRYHYLVDVVAGLFLAPASFRLANWLLGRFDNRALPIPNPAAWAEELARMGISSTEEAIEPSAKVEEQP